MTEGSGVQTPALRRRVLAGTGLAVTPVCVGGSPLGSVPAVFGYDVPEGRALDTIAAVLAGPLNFLDTSANYADGESERRIGRALAQRGGLPAGFVLATKADRDPATGDFSGTQVRRSVEGSLRRLGVGYLPLVHLHDPEHVSFEEAMATGGPVEALLDLRDQGVIGHVGVAGGPVGLLRRFVATGAFEVVLTHNRWSLVDRSADRLLDDAQALGMGVLNAAVFGGGVLAGPRGHRDSYAYQPLSGRMRRRIELMRTRCEDAGVPLAAAALQFSLRDVRVHSTVVGLSRPERLQQVLALARASVPDEVFAALDELAGQPEEWLW